MVKAFFVRADDLVHGNGILGGEMGIRPRISVVIMRIEEKGMVWACRRQMRAIALSAKSSPDYRLWAFRCNPSRGPFDQLTSMERII